jgi:hypothetical protein
MKITNKRHLHKSIYNFAKKHYEEYKPTPKQYSVTTLLNPIRVIILSKRHYEEMEADCGDKKVIEALFGIALHSVLEKCGDTGFEEYEFKILLDNGYTISGRIDAYDPERYEVIDHKTCKASKITYDLTDEWERQGLLYAWALRKLGKYCNKALFNAFIKDFNAYSKTKNYPKHNLEEIHFIFLENDFEVIDYWIKKRINEIIEAEQIDDNDLPLCSEKERWDNDLRCKEYCDVCKFCSYYKEKYEKEIKEE